MEKQVTFGHIMTLLSVIVIPLIIWGVNVEKRLETPTMNKEAITEIKADIKSSQNTNQKNFDKVIKQLNDIKLEMKDKEDRK